MKVAAPIDPANAQSAFRRPASGLIVNVVKHNSKLQECAPRHQGHRWPKVKTCKPMNQSAAKPAETPAAVTILQDKVRIRLGVADIAGRAVTTNVARTLRYIALAQAATGTPSKVDHLLLSTCS